ncbi:hypothetical protein SH580_06025 [Coraliomargarita algicola]|uniref:3-keto-disaccharide hydrolase domain-containing protein n=1 Tax=Coraliomargarita algicola TaxID=3092156 RepID=A0ABZ0RW93_9BACT|nr:hypothetical protein [Coraliomargarita sp. J2-16]WPJ97264.1 hypothetical protein SH580_06025 [Coraliomargarita sp. J2-16]
MNTPKPLYRIPLLAISIFSAITHAETIVLEDDMDYANTSSLRSKWSSINSSPSLASELKFTPLPLSLENPIPISGKFMLLNNGIAYRKLGQTITTDWTLTARVLFSSYRRGLRVFLLNDTGEEGYGFGWSSQNPDQFDGNGSVRITKFQDDDYDSWNTFRGSQDFEAVNSGHPVTGYKVTATPDSDQHNANYDMTNWHDMMTATLTWDASSGQLTLFINGERVSSHQDTEFNRFSSIYLRGNTSAYFDKIVLTVSDH